MKRCSNSHKGCPELARGGAVHYCTDCYHAWQEGGYGAVQASIDAKSKPTLDKHECVGTAQITALQAEVAEYAAFKAEVVELYTFRFKDEVKLPDPNTMLDRIRWDRMVAATARTAMSRDGVQLVVDTTPAARATCTIEWLKGLKMRLAFHCAAERVRADRIRDLEWQLADVMGKCQPSPRLTMTKRFKAGTPHPPAKPVTEPDLTTRKQLDRIESLSKQAATNGPGGWPFAAFLVGAIVAYLIK